VVTVTEGRDLLIRDIRMQVPDAEEDEEDG
jgi:hypothetical protein